MHGRADQRHLAEVADELGKMCQLTIERSIPKSAGALWNGERKRTLKDVRGTAWHALTRVRHMWRAHDKGITKSEYVPSRDDPGVDLMKDVPKP